MIRRLCHDSEAVAWSAYGIFNYVQNHAMMTSSNEIIFRVTGPLWRESTGGFPSQRPVTGSFGVFFDLRLNKRLSKRSRRRWFEMSSRSLWCHCNAQKLYALYHALYIISWNLFNVVFHITHYNESVHNCRRNDSYIKNYRGYRDYLSYTSLFVCVCVCVVCEIFLENLLRLFL